MWWGRRATITTSPAGGTVAQLGGPGGGPAIKNAEDRKMERETEEIMEILGRRPELALRVLRLALRQAAAAGILPAGDPRSEQSA